VDLHPQQARVGQLAEVPAGRGPGDSGLIGEHAGRQCPAVVERHQDPAAGPVGQQRADLGDLDVAEHRSGTGVHASTVAQR